jgi:transcriptional antiterminator NusG
MNMNDETQAPIDGELETATNEDSVASPTQAEAVESAEVVEGAEEERAIPDNPNMRWYVVQAFSGYEKKVMLSIVEHVERAEKEEYFGRILVPTEEVVEMKGGQKRTSERKFFPGYVLVQMEMTDETWHLVKGVPRVAGFIGGVDNRPVPITDKEANEIIQQVSDSADKPKMKFTFAPGEIVRIVDGPFQDFSGTVEDANFEKAKLKVSVTIFGRSTPVELDFTQVEKG